MKKIAKLCGLVTLSTLTISPIAYANEVIGVNSAIKGDVTIQTGTDQVRKAVVKDEIRLRDAINSSNSSSLQILLKDQTTFTVGPNCDMVIDEFVYDPNKSTNKLTASVSKGMFRFMSGGVSKSGPDAVEITTPVSSLGIRGTIVEGIIGAEAQNMAEALNLIPAGSSANPGASLFVLRGPGAGKVGNNNKGEISVTNQAGTVNVTNVGQVVFVPNAFTAPIIGSLSALSFSTFSSQLRTVPGTGPDTLSFNVSSNLQSVGTTTSSTASSSTTGSAGSSSSAGAGASGSTATGAGASTGAGAAGSPAAGAGAAGAGAAAGVTAGTLGVVGAVAGVATVATVAADGGDDDEDIPVSP